MDTTDIATGPEELREGWHNRTISEIVARLSFLHALVSIEVHKDQRQGSDIVVRLNKSARRINIEVQQDVSGGPWTHTTIPGWTKRHDLITFVVFVQPFLERVQNTLDKDEYAFFRREDVFLISENQVSEMVAVIGALTIRLHHGL